jgi:hypothetical protein
MVTDAAGMEDQSDEDSGKFMTNFKERFIKIFLSPLSIISAHKYQSMLLSKYIDMQML